MRERTYEIHNSFRCLADKCQCSGRKSRTRFCIRNLRRCADKFNGDVGIYVRHLKSGRTVAINADSIFPTASMIKIPITIGMFDKIEKGEIDYHSELIYKDSLLYAGVDILGSFKSGEKIALGKSIDADDNHKRQHSKLVVPVAGRNRYCHHGELGVRS